MYDGELHRFATVPAGAEQQACAILANGTVMFNVQHPSGTNPPPYNRGVVGVVNGFKATMTSLQWLCPKAPTRFA